MTTVWGPQIKRTLGGSWLLWTKLREFVEVCARRLSASTPRLWASTALPTLHLESPKPKRSLVFVYGTLKRGFSNYRVYLKPAVELHKAKFLGKAETTDGDLCIVVMRDAAGCDELVPCMFRDPSGKSGVGPIQGELFEVDEDALKCLDILEGIEEDDYYKTTIRARLLNDPTRQKDVECFAYLQRFDPSFVALPVWDEYTTALDQKYLPWRDVPDLDALAFLWGRDAIDAIERRLADGVDLADAWLEVLHCPYEGIRVDPTRGINL